MWCVITLRKRENNGLERSEKFWWGSTQTMTCFTKKVSSPDGTEDERFQILQKVYPAVLPRDTLSDLPGNASTSL